MKFALSLGISITEQGYSSLDDDIFKMLKFINIEEYNKNKDDTNSSTPHTMDLKRFINN